MSIKEKTFQEIDLVEMFPGIIDVDIIYLKLPDTNYNITGGLVVDDFLNDKITLKLEKPGTLGINNEPEPIDFSKHGS